MNSINELTGIYPLNKTLKFELKPLGRTLENIKSKGLITQDIIRAEDYIKVKDIIDRYHKVFIDKSLEGLTLKTEDLEHYMELAKSPNDNAKKLDEIKSALRNQIATAFTSQDTYNQLFNKDLIKKILPSFVKSEEEKRLVAEFSQFTTYLTGFNTNRKNLYSKEDKSTSIANRIIHDNLPRFLDNIQSFRKIADCEVNEHFADIEVSFKSHIYAKHLADVFKIEYFNSALTQKQIESYNGIIGGITLDDGTKLQGINEYVNLYNQSHREAHLPLLKPLYKMILSDRAALSWLPEEFTSDVEMTAAIKEAHESLRDILFGTEENSLRNLLLNIDSYDEHHIYITNDKGLTNISQHIFGQYDVYTSAIKQQIKEQLASTKKGKSRKTDDDAINSKFKSMKSFSLAELNECAKADDDHKTQRYFKTLRASESDAEQQDDLLTKIDKAYAAAKDILSGNHGNIGQSESETETIKNLLDAYKSLQHFIKPLLGSGDEAVKDNDFDTKLQSVWDSLNIITPLYNKVRNWLTRKPFSTEKIKLNFENPALLSGWANPKANSGVIFRKDNNTYYLAVLDKSSKKLLDKIQQPASEEDCIYLVDYLYGGGMEKNIQNLMVINGVVEKKNGRKESSGPNAGINVRLEEDKMKYLPPEINRIRKEKTYSVSDSDKSNKFCKQDLTTFIDYYKSLTCAYYKSFDFTFKPSSEYSNFSEFTDHVKSQAYQLHLIPFSMSHLMKLADEGKLYLFQIWNKDFSKFSSGTPNMHTLYWRMLFDERNLDNVVYKLDGGAELFYRKGSLELANTTIHHAHQPILNKNKQNAKRQSTFGYDIVKNRRYTTDKFQLHVPITINFNANDKKSKINDPVLDIIRNGGIKHIIGIDRGERHLLYLTLIDLKGNIIKQMTLNDVVAEHHGNTYATNYKDLLTEREGSRDEARRNWKQIDNIKDIKQGYLSQVVHTIGKMMVECKAIVVIEDLSKGFMRGRQKIERNVYEQFEKNLIDKLNYYVDKHVDADEAGGLLHALQLTSKFESFEKLGTQCGCLFYIPAWNTSKIDPVTGFVNLFDTRFKNIDSAHEFFNKFKSICYNAQKDRFEFAFDYNDFTTKAEGTRTQWTLCSYGTRIVKFRNPDKSNNWDCKEVVIADEFKKAFAEADIDINGDIKEAIGKLSDRKQLEQLMTLMKLLLQMRNSEIGTDVDYLISPVADENGDFYDSRCCNDNLPHDADANGAYNIARKGLWAVMQIKATADGKHPTLTPTNKAWLKFAQEKPYAK